MADSLKLTINLGQLRALSLKLRNAKKPIDRDTANLVGREVIAAMKELIASGESPIEGKGNFPAYKNPARYPGKLKPSKPVNLKLDGHFLDALKHKVQPAAFGFNTRIDYFDKDESIKEKGHREGANSQPKRPTIPKGSEKYIKSIRALIVSIYQKRINKLLKG